MTGITVVMPAYREEGNLTATVEDFLATLEEIGERHCVVVVNDGSSDRTGQIADSLAVRFPGRVEVVHHKVNLGYGAAVRSGIAAALERTDSQRLFLTDSDGQFRAGQLPSFLALARSERADAVIGYRPRRADPLIRRVNGFLWTQLSRLMLRVGARDIDCAYKLVDRRVLDGVHLRGDAALISPELVAKIRTRDARILQRPVDHFAREHGVQTGASPLVILRSLLGMVGLWFELARAGRAHAALRRLVRPADPVLRLVTLTAVALSVGAYLFFTGRGQTLAYPDAVSHLLIARRVVEASTPGAAQLGGVWLPLPHLLALPAVWNDSLYYSGLAESAVSMIAYVLGVRYLYLTGKGLTGSRLAGVIAGAVFACNPNVLYLQSTPMTEMLLIGCVAASAYYLMRWCQTGAYRHLCETAAAVLFATLTRYEGWVLCLAVLATVGYVSLRRVPRQGVRDRIRLAEANVLFFAFLGFSGIVGWVVWNAAILHDPLYFQNGTFAKPSLWVSQSEVAIGDWGVSLRTYLYAMQDDLGTVALILGAVGLVHHLVHTRLRIDSIAPVPLLIFVPFFTYALYSGQRPLHVAQITGDLYNLRFGLLMIVPVALFIAYPVAAIHRMRWGWARAAARTVVTGAAVTAVATVAVTGSMTLKEAEVFRAGQSEQANVVAASWLRTHYDGGGVLMESFGNESVTFASRIPTSKIIYEGSYRLWLPALADPASHGIRWIYMRRTSGSSDDVWNALHGSAALNFYEVAYSDPNRVIYRSDIASLPR